MSHYIAFCRFQYYYLFSVLVGLPDLNNINKLVDFSLASQIIVLELMLTIYNVLGCSRSQDELLTDYFKILYIIKTKLKQIPTKIL